MEQNQIDEFVSNQKQELDLIKEQIKAASSKDEFNTLADKVNDIADGLQIEEKSLPDYVKSIQEQANGLAEDVKELRQTKGVEPGTLKEELTKLANNDNFKKSLREGRKVDFSVKAASDILTTDVTAATFTTGLDRLSLPGVAAYPWIKTPVFDNIRKRIRGEKVGSIRWLEESSSTNNAARVAEGGSLSQSAYTLVEKEGLWQKVGHFMKISEESLEDSEELIAFLNDELRNGLMALVEDKLTDGSGSSDVLGLVTAAKSFSLPNGMNKVNNANIYDVLRVAAAYVGRGLNAASSTDTDKTGYMANVAIVDPLKYHELALVKDKNDNYVIPPWADNKIAGMRVLMSEKIASDTFVVGDFTKAQAHIKRNLTIKTSETAEDGDWIADFVSMKATMRIYNLIKTLEKYAFCSGTFTNGISAIDKTTA